MFSPAVITSKAAQQDLSNIKAQHADLMNLMSNQQIKMVTYQQQKAEANKNQQIMMQEMQKEQMATSSEAVKLAVQNQKDQMQHTQKMAELDIKRKALSQP